MNRIDIATRINRFHCACNTCHRTPLIIRTYTEHFNVGAEWEDSLSDDVCLVCIARGTIAHWIHEAKRHIDAIVFSVKTCATCLPGRSVGYRISMCRKLYKVSLGRTRG
jgi:hypothetical protein